MAVNLQERDMPAEVYVSHMPVSVYNFTIKMLLSRDEIRMVKLKESSGKVSRLHRVRACDGAHTAPYWMHAFRHRDRVLRTACQDHMSRHMAPCRCHPDATTMTASAVQVLRGFSIKFARTTSHQFWGVGGSFDKPYPVRSWQLTAKPEEEGEPPVQVFLFLNPVAHKDWLWHVATVYVARRIVDSVSVTAPGARESGKHLTAKQYTMVTTTSTCLV